MTLPRLNWGMVGAIGLLALFWGVWIALWYVSLPDKSIEESGDYSARNRERLKAAQRYDLITCKVRNGDGKERLRGAVIVDEHYPGWLIGRAIDKNTVSPVTHYHYSAFDDCVGIRVFRPGETRATGDIIGNIILYGFPPSPPVH